MVDNCLNNRQCSEHSVCISTFDNRRFFCLCDVGWTGKINIREKRYRPSIESPFALTLNFLTYLLE